MALGEDIKDFFIGLGVLFLGLVLAGVFLLFGPFMAAIGWVMISLMLIVVAIFAACLLLVLLGKSVRTALFSKKL